MTTENNWTQKRKPKNPIKMIRELRRINTKSNNKIISFKSPLRIVKKKCAINRKNRDTPEIIAILNSFPA